MLDPRGRLVLTALNFAGLRHEAGGSAVEIQPLRRWLDSWAGIGAIERGLAHQGYDLQLARYDEQGWRATFYPSGMEHSATSAIGSAWERTPWRAVQRAAWMALTSRANAP
jgi:hypothetical protein